MSYKRMTVKDWIAVPSNPIQRDTERHLARAKHLLTPQQSHMFVFAAELPSGNLIKLDGHTRALAWEREMVETPPYVFVGLIPVKNSKEAEELYKTFDSKAALETSQDKMSGAFNKHNFNPESDLLRGGSITTGLRIAYAVLKGGQPFHATQGVSKKSGAIASVIHAADVYQMVDEFSYELHALDAFGLRRGQLRAGSMGAFLISYRKYGHKVLPFWQGVFAKEGNKVGREMDAVQATVQLLENHKRLGHSAASELCLRSLGGVEMWMKDAVTTRLPSPYDTHEYLKGHERAAERLIKKAKAA